MMFGPDFYKEVLEFVLSNDLMVDFSEPVTKEEIVSAIKKAIDKEAVAGEKD